MAQLNHFRQQLLFMLIACVSFIVASRPNVTGIHHVKVPVSNINISLAWYTRVMGAQHITNLDHINSAGERYAVEMQLPSFGKTVMELRLDMDQAKSQQMWDPITWGVQGLSDIQAWEKWLQDNNVSASPVFTGVTGWLLVFQDPDRRFLRLYTYDSHAETNQPDVDSYWLGPEGS